MAANTTSISRRAWIGTARLVLFLALLLFAPAWSLRYWQAWLYGFIFVASTSLIAGYFLKHDPKLVERRIAVGPAAEERPEQKIIMTLTSIAFVLLLAVPGFDHRWHWSTVPSWLVLAANGIVALSFVIFFLVLNQNRYAASTIRVEANQPVISTGAYAIVRHPLYAGALLLVFFTPLALGSYWGLLVLIPIVPVLAWRLLDEEQYLSSHLPNYDEYCRKTRYRLIPLVW